MCLTKFRLQRVFVSMKKNNPTEVADDLVCVTIHDSDENEELDGALILLSRKGTLSLIEKLAKAASLLRKEYTD